MRTFGIIVLSLILLIALLLGIRTLFNTTPQEAQTAPDIDRTALAGPIITPLDPSRGPKDARVTIIEFSDFECPFCRQASETIHEILNQYPKDVRYVWKDFPNARLHPESVALHIAAQCAGQQGTFWEYHDVLFDRPIADEAIDLYTASIATALRINAEQFTACQKSGRMQALVERNIDEGKRLNIQGTPTFFINGKRFEGALSPATFQTIITPFLSP